MNCGSFLRGYYQISMEPEAMLGTAFITPEGKCEMLRMSFGLCSAPCVFRGMISAILRELPSGAAFDCLDDIIIPAEGVHKIGLVLELFTCLCNEVSADGVGPDESCQVSRQDFFFIMLTSI